MSITNTEIAPEYVYNPKFNDFSETCRVGRLDTAHHGELCLGVLARCHPQVTPELKLAIENIVEWAAHLGLSIPVSAKNLKG